MSINNDLWVDMPRFHQEKLTPFMTVTFNIGSRKIVVRFDSKEDVSSFVSRSGINLQHNCKVFTMEYVDPAGLSRIFDQKITDKTKSIWYPFKSHWGGVKHKYVSKNKIALRYPVYIVSKGRWKNGLTTKTLDDMGIPHYIVVEAHEEQNYKNSTNGTILVLPQKYLDNYDTCDDLGNTKSKGPGAARNYCIDHSSVAGFSRHWVMDDNIDAFHYLTDNEKLEVESSDTLRAAEDFTDRFVNVPLSGLNYYSFCKKTDKVPPFIRNTRIYSCLLLDNTSGYRWRGRYNEDTDLSLRILKDGLCTIQFNAFLCGKVTTQRMKGGNTKEFYDSEGTLPKSQMIANLHPDVASVVWRFNRWHHYVNYKVFDNSLILKRDYRVSSYGLEKVPISATEPIKIKSTQRLARK